MNINYIGNNIVHTNVINYIIVNENWIEYFVSSDFSSGICLPT